MRKALILLAVIALLILVAGALNNSVAFDVDYVAGTVTEVSLFWVSGVIAVIVFVAGSLAAWLAQSATTGTRRKLEAELQTAFERLREAESLAARPARAVAEPAAPAAESPSVHPAGDAASDKGTAVTVLATSTASEDAQTVMADETGVAQGDEAETAVAGDGSAADDALTAVADSGQTAVTMAAPAADGPEAAVPDDGEPVETGADAADPPA